MSQIRMIEIRRIVWPAIVLAACSVHTLNGIHSESYLVRTVSIMFTACIRYTACIWGMVCIWWMVYGEWYAMHKAHWSSDCQWQCHSLAMPSHLHYKVTSTAKLLVLSSHLYYHSYCHLHYLHTLPFTCTVNRQATRWTQTAGRYLWGANNGPIARTGCHDEHGRRSVANRC